MNSDSFNVFEQIIMAEINRPDARSAPRIELFACRSHESPLSEEEVMKTKFSLPGSVHGLSMKSKADEERLSFFWRPWC